MSRYSDMRELNDLLNVTRKGKLFLVDVYDHTRLNLGIIRLYTAGDKLLMNVVGDTGEENDLSAYAAQHKVEPAQVKHRDLEITEKDPHATTFYDAEDISLCLVRDDDDDRKKDDYLIGYWLRSFAYMPRVGDKLTVKDVQKRKFLASPRNVVESGYDTWYVRNGSGDWVGVIEKFDAPRFAKKYAGHKICGSTTAYADESVRWHKSLAIGASLEECVTHLLKAL